MVSPHEWRGVVWMRLWTNCYMRIWQPSTNTQTRLTTTHKRGSKVQTRLPGCYSSTNATLGAWTRGRPCTALAISWCAEATKLWWVAQDSWNLECTNKICYPIIFSILDSIEPSKLPFKVVSIKFGFHTQVPF